MAITIAVMLQDRGRIVADTKLDLAVDPSRFLDKATHLWDPLVGFGQIGNQAAGYLIPMGPAFLLGRAAGLPAWVVQRAWVAGVLVVALWGAARLARELGVGTPSSRVIGALAYAVAPAMLATVGIASGGQLPSALAPWAVVPLVGGWRGGSPRAAAARSALFIALMGGVNAASTLAAIVPAAIYLLTRQRPERARLLAWWLPSVALATAWWALPLVVQARYGIDFLAYTEDASTTTLASSAPEILRGTGYWLGYLFDDGPWIRGAWALVSAPAAIAGSTAVAAAGLWGLARRDVPERTFLVLSALAGAVAMGAAYAGDLGGPLSPLLREVLDGPMRPFRNVQKLDAALRLPLCIGLAHALSVAAASATTARPRVRPATASALAAALGLVAVTAAALPLPRGDLFPAGSFAALPRHWEQLADWLAREGQGRAVVLPSAAFGEYRWGRPLDEPLGALAETPWASRNLIPLGSVGTTRILDEVERRLDRGEPPAGLADLFRRSGVGTVVVRADLDPLLAESVRPVYVVEALRRTPGLVHAASFGPSSPAPTTTDRVASSDVTGDGATMHALEVFTVSGPTPSVRAPGGPPLRVAGGPESIVQAADAGLIGNRAAILVGDHGSGDSEGSVILTDAYARRDEEFGRIADSRSAVLAEDETVPGTTRQPRLRALEAWAPATARINGATRVRSSSYGSSVVRQPELAPTAAFDGDPSSAWVPGRRQAGEWIEVSFEQPVRLDQITVSLLRDEPHRRVVRDVVVTTDAGRSTHRLDPVSAPQRLELGGQPTARVRITLQRVSRTFSTAGAGITEIAIPGVAVERLVRLPAAEGHVEAVVLDRARRDPRDATRRDEEVDLRREFRLDEGQTFEITGSSTEPAVRTDGAGPVRASSTWAGLPSFGIEQALDGSPATAWIASPHDPSPSVLVRWPHPVRLSRVEIDRAPGPFLRPTRVRVATPAGDREAALQRGRAAFDVVETDTAVLSFPEVTDEAIGAAERGLVFPAALALASLRMDAGPPASGGSTAPASTDPCGAGPVVEVDGALVRTRLTGTDNTSGAPTVNRFHSCDPVSLGPGRHIVRTRAEDEIGTLALVEPSRPVTARTRSTTIRSWDRDRRVIAVGRGEAATLVVAENASDGWQAELDGTRLQPVLVDGWSQGFLLPAGEAGAVTLDLPAARTYRAGIIAGGLGLLAVVLLALRNRGRPVSRAAPPPLHPVVAVTAIVASGLLLAGPVAIVVPVAVAGRRLGIAAPLAGLCMAGAGTLTLAQAGAFPGSGRGAFSATAQALAVAAVVLVGTNLLEERRR